MHGRGLAGPSNEGALEAGSRRAVIRKAIGAIHRTVAPWLEGHLIVLAALGALDLVHLTDATVTKAPQYGEHNEEVLTTILGHSSADVSALREQDVIG